MKRKSIRRWMTAVTAAAVAMVMCTAGGFAAGASDSPDPTSKDIQARSGDTATVTLGKILTVNQENRFPKATDFVFEIERVQAWDNANTNTAESGRQIDKADMPMPLESDTAHQSVTVSGDKASVLVGNFSDTAAQNRSTGDGEDTAARRTRTTPVQITFAKAGYYLYKVAETGSVPADIKGVDYDTNTYYMAFYVCNRVDEEGNTIDGVYVHNITSFTNEAGSDANAPDLSDIQNVTDNGGEAAGANTGRVNADGTVSHDNAKVGVNPPETPNRLEAYRMWNAQTTHDVVLKKNVTGNLGDRTKQFEFNVTLSGLEPGQTYDTDAPAEDTGDVSSAVISEITKGSLSENRKTFTADESGEAAFMVKLTDDQCFVINALPMTAQYSFCEAASDHVAKYEITASGGSGENPAVIAKTSDSNGQVSDKQLATAVETVDRYDGTVTVLYINNRDLATITGVAGADYMAWAVMLLLAAAAAAGTVRKRRLYAEAEAEA